MLSEGVPWAAKCEVMEVVSTLAPLSILLPSVLFPSVTPVYACIVSLTECAPKPCLSSTATPLMAEAVGLAVDVPTLELSPTFLLRATRLFNVSRDAASLLLHFDGLSVRELPLRTRKEGPLVDCGRQSRTRNKNEL